MNSPKSLIICPILKKISNQKDGKIKLGKIRKEKSKNFKLITSYSSVG